MKKIKWYAMFLVICFLAAQTAMAQVTYSFLHIVEVNDGSTQFADGQIGENQLFVDVNEGGTNQVLFTFRNTGPQASSIADIYFDDGALASFAFLDNSDPGVAFAQFASPGNLPGGNNLAVPFAATYSFDSDPPVQPKGINPGESLGITFNLLAGNDLQDVVDDLDDGTLRIGLHVQGFASEGSEAFVNNGRDGNGSGVVPAPGAILLGSIGIFFIGLIKRKSYL
ncbi:MAG: hypothetical protein H8D47_04130 [Planctomycetes bacterium]|nr:hypothetical protein [Planctomycetota bacterium]